MFLVFLIPPWLLLSNLLWLLFFPTEHWWSQGLVLSPLVSIDHLISSDGFKYRASQTTSLNCTLTANYWLGMSTAPPNRAFHNMSNTKPLVFSPHPVTPKPAPSSEFTISTDVLIYSLAHIKNLQVTFEFSLPPLHHTHPWATAWGTGWLRRMPSHLVLEDAGGRAPDEQWTTPGHFTLFFFSQWAQVFQWRYQFGPSQGSDM